MELHPSNSLPPAGRATPAPLHERGGGYALTRDWPTPTAHKPNPKEAEIARKFETLIAETLLRSARAASLGDDGLGNTGANIRDMVDHQRAEAIARAAPLGVARLLAAERAAQ